MQQWILSGPGAEALAEKARKFSERVVGVVRCVYRHGLHSVVLRIHGPAGLRETSGDPDGPAAIEPTLVCLRHDSDDDLRKVQASW